MSERRRVKLSAVAKVTVGHVGSMAAEYRTEGIPFLRSQNVVEHALDLADLKFIHEGFHEKLSKSSLRGGDVVTVRTGKPGATTTIPHGFGPANCSDLVITRPGPDLDSRWLSYYINGVAKGFIESQLVGAVQQHFNVGSAKAMLLDLPTIKEQRAIAEVLGALDDKIAANFRVVEATEALSRATFDSLPQGPAERLTQFARFVNGKAFTKDATGTGRVVIRIAELNCGPGDSTVYNDIEVAEEHLARPGDLLFAWSASLTVGRWYRPEAIINQHIFKVIPISPYPMWLIYEILLRRLEDFRLIAADKATTMGHIQRRHLEQPVQVPAQEAVARVDSLMSALWDGALMAERESLTLAKLRDTLLPALMSGRLRVRDAERHVEAVV